MDTITDTRDLSKTRNFYPTLCTAEILDPAAQQSFFQTDILKLLPVAQHSQHQFFSFDWFNDYFGNTDCPRLKLKSTS